MVQDRRLSQVCSFLIKREILEKGGCGACGADGERIKRICVKRLALVGCGFFQSSNEYDEEDEEDGYGELEEVPEEAAFVEDPIFVE